MYYMLVACMAGPLNTGQDIATYLLLQLIPIVIHHLVHLVLPEDPMSFRILAKTIAETSAWRLRGHPQDARPKRFKCFKKPKMKMVSKAIQDKTITKKLPSYLAPALFAAFKVGCRVEIELRRFLHPIRRVPRFLALQSASTDLQSLLLRQIQKEKCTRLSCTSLESMANSASLASLASVALMTFSTTLTP